MVFNQPQAFYREINMAMNSNTLVGSVFLACALSACGGGGGSSSTGTNSTTTNTTSTSAYGGSKQEARITRNNSLAFIRNFKQSQNTAANTASYKSVNATTDTSLPLTSSLDKAIKYSLDNTQRYQQRAVNSTTACEYGGTSSLKGDVNDSDGSGSFSIQFNQCKTSSSLTLNGLVDINAKAFSTTTSEVLQGTFYFTNLTATDSTGNLILSGKIDKLIDLTNSQVQFTSNLFSYSPATGEQIMVENFQELYAYLNQTDLASLIQGRMYNSQYGYVRLITPQTLYFNNGLPYYGELVFIGNQGTTVQVLFQTDKSVVINVDENGDGVYDSSDLYEWVKI